MKKLLSFITGAFPKIVIAFSTHGCMGQRYEFLFIGYVVREYDKPKGGPAQGLHIYAVQPLIKGSSENRNRPEQPIDIEEVYQLQHLGMNLYIHYK